MTASGVVRGAFCAMMLLLYGNGSDVNAITLKDKFYDHVSKEEVERAKETLKGVLPDFDVVDCLPFNRIVGDFQGFLAHHEIRENLALWPAMLTTLSPELSCLLHDERYKTAKIAICSTMLLAANAFGEFVSFCESECCDLTSRSIIYDYLKYICVLIGNMDCSQQRDKVMVDFKNMFNNITAQSNPIIGIADRSVFYSVAALLDTLPD